MKTREIVLAVDPEAEEATKTIQWASENFLRQDDRIHLVMVLAMDAEFMDDQDIVTITGDSLSELENEITSKTTKAMNAVANNLKSRGYHVMEHIFKSKPEMACQVLVDYIDTSKMDCLIMGSRNLSGWKR
ncbi:hypothetical protein EC973_007760 [Apophysomyces ossiformis]|uniref:UspA domain-containing protein n=1 Tax=Apophysomyces ossiformis TaxID=679940 RepID=A0A8H7BT01_9FUNG|nr:hypothetical protein EC973_007760 [Apophysomyces ossiformis]